MMLNGCSCQITWKDFEMSCKQKFSFDNSICVHPSNNLGNCEAHHCPIFNEERFMFGPFTEPSWVCKTEIVNESSGSKVIFKDEFSGDKTLSDVINSVVECKTDGRNFARLNVKRRLGGLNGAFKI